MNVDRDTAEQILAAARRGYAARAAAMPDDQAALATMQSAFLRLLDLGWRRIAYCPKDGSTFEVIEPGSTGVCRCRYLGTWPDGGFFVEDGRDLWPSRPILFRPIENDETA